MPGLLDWVQEIGRIPGKADNIAEQTFPNDLRDSSKKNAFRHSLGTGMMAQHFGAGSGLLGDIVGPLAGKGAGYLWEALGYGAKPSLIANKAYNTDTLHDLNANAIGADVATMSKDPAVLADQLKWMAMAAQKQQPPGLLQSSPGYLTYTELPTTPQKARER